MTQRTTAIVGWVVVAAFVCGFWAVCGGAGFMWGTGGM